MRIITKILFAFLAISGLSIAQMGFTYKFQTDIYNNSLVINNIEGPLVLLVQQGISYGSIATEQIHVAVLHAQGGQFEDIREHKMTYDVVELKLDDIFNRDSKIFLSQSIRPQEEKDRIATGLKEISRLNLLMFDLGTRAFMAIDNKDIETAYALTVGSDYEKYQKELQSNVKDLSATINGGVFEIEDNVINGTRKIIIINFIFSIIIVILIIIVLMILRSFITRKEKELKVREKMEQKYRILFENTIDAIFIADIGTKQLVDCNKSAEKLIGYSRTEILSMKADELHPKDKLKETMEGFKKQSIGEIKSIFTEVLTKNNKRIPVRINASAVKIGNKIYNQGIFIEIK